MKIRCASLAFLLALVGCASVPNAQRAGWHHVSLPGKEATRYAWETKDGRSAVFAQSDRSASMWRLRLEREPLHLGQVSFSWWVQDLIAEGNVADVRREDSPARVLFAFDGDIGRLAPRTRAMFDLAEALTGERPPYATLMYVWDAKAPVGSVIINPRSDRIRKIVVDSGPQELRRWRDHQRDLTADFRLAFGEDPGPLKAVALMTDSDNTASSVKSWYGPVSFTDTSAVLLPATPPR